MVRRRQLKRDVKMVAVMSAGMAAGSIAIQWFVDHGLTAYLLTAAGTIAVLTIGRVVISYTRRTSPEDAADMQFHEDRTPRSAKDAYWAFVKHSPWVESYAYHSRWRDRFIAEYEALAAETPRRGNLRVMK